MSKLYESDRQLAYAPARPKPHAHLAGASSVRSALAAPAAAWRRDGVAETLPLRELVSNRLLAALPEAEFARLVPFLEPFTLNAGQLLRAPHEPVRHIYFPENGVLSSFCAMQDGSIAEVRMVGREGLVGLSALFGPCPLPLSIQTAVGGSALRLRADALRAEFERGGKLAALLLNYAGRLLGQLAQRAACNVRHKVEARLACWLLMLRDRIDTDELDFTHEQMAHHLCTRRAGITSIAKELENREVIRYSRGHIRILDRAALAANACECYEALAL